jgi:KDO2-lipid IV(A) lauroyltransferase
VRYRLHLVRKNISLSFPNKTLKEQRQIINNFYHHFANLLAEIIYGYRISDEEMRQRVVFENVELLESLALQKHGVIIYLGHIYNWEWMADIGHRFTDPSILALFVYRKLSNSRTNKDMKTIRTKRGGVCIEKHQLLRKLVALRNEPNSFIIALLADQKPTPNNANVWTTFLNQETAFLDGGETLAHKFNYSAVFANITCPERGYYHVRFELVTENPTTMSKQQITLKYVQLLEQNIKQQPHMWLWTHNRWKWSKSESERLKHVKQHKKS